VWYSPLYLLPVAAIALIFNWFAIARVVPHRPVKKKTERKSVKLPLGTLSYIGMAAGLNTACEGAAILWGGTLLTKIAPELAAYSGLGLAFYGLCGGTVRIIGDNLRERFGDLRVMMVSLATAVMGFAALGQEPGFWPSVIAFAAVGFGLGMTFPCLFSFTAKLVPNARAKALGYVAAVGGAPRIIMPLVLGFLADRYGLSVAFVSCSVVAAAAAALIVFTYTAAEAKLQTKA
jgi:MFS family permease